MTDSQIPIHNICWLLFWTLLVQLRTTRAIIFIIFVCCFCLCLSLLFFPNINRMCHNNTWNRWCCFLFCLNANNSISKTINFANFQWTSLMIFAMIENSIWLHKIMCSDSNDNMIKFLTTGTHCFWQFITHLSILSIRSVHWICIVFLPSSECKRERAFVNWFTAEKFRNIKK